MIAKDNLAQFKLLRLNRSAQEQVTDFVREEIHSGTLKPGAKFPSNLELAAKWETNITTIQRALGPLVKEGLLIRVPCVGTFVRQREEKLTCVAVYGDCGTTDAKGSPYTQAVREALREELEKAGIEMDLRIDSRPLDQNHAPWNSLIKAAEQRQFQAVIATDVNRPLVDWVSKLSVPVAYLGATPSIQNNVDHDMRQFVELGLQDLARQGCRSVGLISPILNKSFDVDNPKGWHLVTFDMLKHFTDVARDLGLTVKNDWMRVIDHDSPAEIPLKTQEQERFGYDEFLKLWSQSEKPEGLLVYTDVMARGVIMAIQKEQVQVPRDLKLALHKNESIDLFCPMPATFVVVSERDMARALIEQVQKQFRGESCERILLPFKLVAHTNP